MSGERLTDTHLPVRYYDGLTSSAEPATLSLWADGRVILQRTGTSRAYRIAELVISDRLGNTPRILRFPDGGKCECPDNDAIDRVLATHPACRHNWPHRLESHMGYVMLAVLIAALVSWSSVRYGIPWLAERAANALPHDVDRRLGSGSLEILDRAVFGPTQLDLVTRERVQARFRGMTAGLPDHDQYRLLFRAGEEIGANAFALPSGIVIMTDDLVRISEHDDELIAILAHELGHLEHRHSLRMAIQSSVVALLIAVITGDIVNTSTLLVALPTVLVNSDYSREFEAEADDYAWQYLSGNGIPTRRFADILTRITGDKETGTLEKYLSSHPGTHERVQRFMHPAADGGDA